ncbi:MAG: L,D-transpeptidase family protein [Eubacterium sp.]|nr:L,D-transpeptidase family protein [Eubacterium sp.]
MKKYAARIMMMLTVMLLLPLAVSTVDVKAEETAQSVSLTKVTGLKLMQESVKKIGVSWQAVEGAKGYEVYVKKPGSKVFTMAKRVTETSCTIGGAAFGKSYEVRVCAYTVQNNNIVAGPYSDSKSIKIKKGPGQIKKVLISTDRGGTQVVIRWSKLKGADSYAIAYKTGKEKSYQFLAETKGNAYGLRKLDQNKKYSFVVYAQKGNVRGEKASKSVSVKPATYLKKNRLRLLAERVRSIGVSGNKYVFTKNSYSNEVKEAYVNYYGYSSKTKYLIWVSLYTQQCTIYTGSKGKWKILYTFDIASGAFGSGTPRGTFKLFMHEKSWNHPTYTTNWVTHFYKRGSFHARPIWKKSKKPINSTLKAPISGGCVRCPDKYAIFIYKKIPLGTKVRIW